MRTEARAVVIGGGVGGCSILYHLAKLGWSDVVLVEQYGLTHGSTWHSAGLVGQLRSTVSLTKMMQYSVGLYADLKDETGKDPGWHELGGLRLASSKPRMEELQRQAGWAKSFGLPVEIISAAEAQELFPPMSTDGVLGAAFLPQDGYLDPSQLTFALADGARLLGADIEQRTRVEAITLKDGRVHEVVTDKGTIRTDVVINAGGMYAPQIARMVGVDVPIITYAHEFLVTEAFDPPLPALPTLRDPDNLVYWRTEVGGLIMGGYERDPAPWALDGVPDGFEAQLLPEDWERFDELLGNSIKRVPAMEQAEVRKLFNGPEAFTPDGEFILGESDVPGFWVAAGFCAHGLAGAGGMGWQMAEWVVNGEPSLDLWHMDIRRFGRQYRSQAYTLARATEVYATYYDIKYPNHERQAGRPLRLSAAYQRLTELGASFGEKSAWERANWFEPNAAEGDESLRPRGWAGENWSPAIHAEAMATRERVGLFDESSFAKFEVHGPGSPELLDYLCGNDVSRPPGVGHLHPDAERPRRHRVRLHRHPAGAAPLPDRDRHRLRQPRHGMGAQAPARRRQRPGQRRDVGLRLLRHLGAARPRGAGAADQERPLQRGLPLHDGAGDLDRLGAVPRGAGDLRRRAGLGAVLPQRVRPGAVGLALGRRARSTASAPAATARSTPCGSRRATASGALT